MSNERILLQCIKKNKESILYLCKDVGIIFLLTIHFMYLTPHLYNLNIEYIICKIFIASKLILSIEL